MWILLFHGHFSNDTENENKSNPNINFKLMYMKQSMKSKGFERRLLLIMWGLFLSLSAFAQQISIKGHVVDATGEPVIGASVVEGRTTNGTITDVDGNFSLSVPANSTLTISFVGYKTQTVPVNGKNSLKVTLQEDTEVLDEVVVVGYGTMKKSDLTGAVSSVGVKDIKDSPVANIGQAMQGKVSGVQIIDAGKPGDNVTIKIRGLGTINNSNPLIVIDGIPATGNKWLMTDVLRDRWGFDGFVVTDYTAISEMIAHGMGDLQQVSAMSLSAGTDMDMVADGFLTTLEKSLKEGKVTMAEIDKACRRILEAKYKLGLFDDPYKYCDASRVKKDIFTAENRTVARKIATETFVLLKNENNLLPLQRKGKIALVGPLANTKANMPGTWSVAAASDKYNSLYESMKQSLAGKAEVLYAKGSNLMYDAQREAEATMFGREMRDPRSAQELLDEALNVASQADVIVAAVGESSEMSGESSSRTNLEMPDAQRDLLTALKKTGKPVVLVYFAGRSTVMTWEQENFPAILNVWFGGSEAADAICDVVFGDVSPSGKLTTTFPKNVGQIPLYYNHLNTGRPLEAGKWFSKFRSNYLDIDNDPLYPFGYGLSYTTFRYGDLQLSNNSMNERGKITASVTVTNTGNYDADEIVQMYIRDMVGSVARPVKELKGFERIHLKKGESRTVSFDITAKQLKFYNSALNWVCEPGEFEVMVGGNSRDVQTKKFSLQ